MQTLYPPAHSSAREYTLIKNCDDLASLFDGRFMLLDIIMKPTSITSQETSEWFFNLNLMLTVIWCRPRSFVNPVFPGIHNMIRPRAHTRSDLQRPPPLPRHRLLVEYSCTE